MWIIQVAQIGRQVYIKPSGYRCSLVQIEFKKYHQTAVNLDWLQNTKPTKLFRIYYVNKWILS